MTGIEVASVWILGFSLMSLVLAFLVLRKRRTSDSKIIVYVNLVHRHGVGSKQALAYREKNKDDEIFLRRADMFDELKIFANRVTIQ